MARKKYLKIPRTAKIKCLNCLAVSKRKVPLDSSPQFFDCDKCGQRMQTPITSCCIICAFTRKKCVPSLRMDAKIKRLELR